MSGTTWDLAPLPVVAAAVALALFAGGFLRLRRRAGARYADGWRVPLFVLAIALATLPVISPLDQAGDEYLLSAHMLQHVLLGDAAPALALVALRGPLLFFVLPAPILRHLGHRRLLRGTLAFLLRPSVSLAVWALVIGAWHIPAAYDYALGHQAVHDVEHLSFLTVGLLLWAQLVNPAHRHQLRPSQRLGCMVAMLAFALALGGMLVATPPLYPAYAEQGVRLFGISPALDQRLAGLVMIGEQLASLALCFAFLLSALRQEAPSRTVLQRAASWASPLAARGRSFVARGGLRASRPL
jgi:putative membrane protein